MKFIRATDNNGTATFSTEEIRFKPGEEFGGNAARGVTIAESHPPDTTFYSLWIKKDGLHPWHTSPMTGTTIVLQGKGTIKTLDDEIHYEAPALVYFPGNVSHTWCDIEEDTLVVVAVLP